MISCSWVSYLPLIFPVLMFRYQNYPFPSHWQRNSDYPRFRSDPVNIRRPRFPRKWTLPLEWLTRCHCTMVRICNLCARLSSPLSSPGSRWSRLRWLSPIRRRGLSPCLVSYCGSRENTYRSMVICGSRKSETIDNEI